MSDTPLLIAGLGNPGAEYARHRHNAGFMAVDVIHASYEFGPWRARFHGLVCDGVLARRKTYLLKPMTYMNESGVSVAAAMRFYKLPLEALVVIHDEIDLAAGKLKAKTGGSDAGNNGLRSITDVLGSDYRRVRIGVGHPGSKARVSSHVLHNFTRAEEDWLVPLLSAIAEAAPWLARNDDPGFMNKIAVTLKPAKKPPPANSPAPKPRRSEES